MKKDNDSITFSNFLSNMPHKKEQYEKELEEKKRLDLKEENYDKAKEIEQKLNIIPLGGSDEPLIDTLELMKFSKENLPNIVFAMEPWLPIKGISWIIAARGVGKSLFSMNIAYAIANGGSFLKFTCPLPRRVLYIDGEMSHLLLQKRFREIIREQGELIFPDNFHFYTPDLYPNHKLPKICNPCGQNYYTRLFVEKNFDVVVFDNLATLAQIDENNANDWYPVQEWLLKLRSLGKTIIIVHHTGKNKREYRGTSRLLDAADSAILLTDIQDDTKDKTDYRKRLEVSFDKNRNFYGKEAESFEAIFHDEKWTVQEIEVSELQIVVDKYHSNMSQREIANELKCSQSKVFKLLKKAKSLGFIRDDGQKK